MTDNNEEFSTTETVKICPVCQWHDIQIGFQPDIYQCLRCDLYFRNPRPTQEEIVRSYNTGAVYKSWQENSSGRDILWQHRLNLILPHIKSGKLLDIGTGDAHFLDFAKKHFNTLGTDVSQTAAQYALNRRHKILVSSISEYQFINDQFDVITMWHVLEHLPDPGESLKIVFRLLKTNGIFVLAIPNELFPITKNRLKKLIGFGPGSPFAFLKFNNEVHLSYFIPKTIKSALDRAGFKILKTGVDDVYSRRTVRNRFVYYISKAIYPLLGKFHFENAMYIICQKRSIYNI